MLDTFIMYDDVELKLLPPEIQPISKNLTENEIKEMKYTPYEHQIEAINFLINKKKCLLLDSMGVGKSLEMMYTAEVLHKRGEVEHCLIICGVDSLRSNWKNEIQKFSNETVRVLGEKISKKGRTSYATISERVEELKKPISEFFVVVNIASLRNDSVIQAISNGPNNFDMIAVDEIHRISKKTSQQGNNLLKLKSKYKVAATGTPITSSPLSVYVPLSWTENDKSTLTNYKYQFCNMGGGFSEFQVTGYKNLDLLQEEIDNCSIRRTFSMVRGNMPKKTIEYELVEMSDEHAKFYESIKNGVKEEADKIELNTNNLLSLVTRLRQATSAPTVLTTQDISSTKIERCVELAEEILESGEKVCIFCNFIESANILGKLLKQYNPVIGTGEQSDDYLISGIENFRNSTNFNLLIATHSKLGTGFSMPECHYMIMLDQPFSAAQQGQTIERIYRITSDQPVYIKILLCKDTYDERVKYIVDRKQDLSDYLVDGVETESMHDLLRQSLMDL